MAVSSSVLTRSTIYNRHEARQQRARQQQQQTRNQTTTRSNNNGSSAQHSTILRVLSHLLGASSSAAGTTATTTTTQHHLPSPSSPTLALHHHHFEDNDSTTKVNFYDKKGAEQMTTTKNSSLASSPRRSSSSSIVALPTASFLAVCSLGATTIARSSVWSSPPMPPAVTALSHYYYSHQFAHISSPFHQQASATTPLLATVHSPTQTSRYHHQLRLRLATTTGAVLPKRALAFLVGYMAVVTTFAPKKLRH